MRRVGVAWFRLSGMAASPRRTKARPGTDAIIERLASMELKLDQLVACFAPPEPDADLLGALRQWSRGKEFTAGQAFAAGYSRTSDLGSS